MVLSMLQFEPTHRPSISELLYHPWMQQEVPTAEYINKEFTHRNVAVKEEREKEREQRRNQRDQIMDNPDESNRANDPPSRGIGVYAKEKLAKHHFFTNLCPDILEKQLILYLSNRNEKHIQNKEVYEINFSLGKQCKAKPAKETLTQTDADLEDELEEAMETLGLVQMMMRITGSPENVYPDAEAVKLLGPDAKAAENVYAVELLSKDVDQFRFDKAAVELTKNCLAFAIE